MDKIKNATKIVFDGVVNLILLWTGLILIATSVDYAPYLVVAGYFVWVFNNFRR